MMKSVVESIVKIASQVSALTAMLMFASPAMAQEQAGLSTADLEVVQLYSQDELLTLIRQNAHLKRIKADDCQLGASLRKL